MPSTQEGGHRTGRQLIKLEHRRFSVWPGSGPNGLVNPLIQNPSQNVGRFPPLLLEWAAFPEAPKQRLWPSRGRTPPPPGAPDAVFTAEALQSTASRVPGFQAQRSPALLGPLGSGSRSHPEATEALSKFLIIISGVPAGAGNRRLFIFKKCPISLQTRSKGWGASAPV